MRYDAFAAILGSIGILLIWWGSGISLDEGRVIYRIGPGVPFLIAGFLFSLVATYRALKRQ
jgi:hypothetical protein